MTQLTIYSDKDAGDVLLDTNDGNEIARALGDIGVDFERWDASQALSDTAGQDEVLAAYDADIRRLMADGGYQSCDVVRVMPGNPNAAELRAKFLSEHTHSEDEVRFFVEGAGAFYIRKGGKVFRVVCERDDLISVPANTTHWFDCGPDPHFCAIRIFTSADGWVGHFTGDDIATRFPSFEGLAA